MSGKAQKSQKTVFSKKHGPYFCYNDINIKVQVGYRQFF